MQKGGYGETRPARDLHFAPAVAELGSQDAQSRIGIRESYQSSQRARWHDGIVVQKKKIPATGQPGRLVTGPGKTEVHLIPYQGYFWEFTRHYLRRAVARTIINNDCLQTDPLTLMMQRLQACPEQFAAVPVSNADGNVNGLGLREC
jgi:hypothetical protein